MVSADAFCVRLRSFWGVQADAGVFWGGSSFGGGLLTAFNRGNVRVTGE